MNGPRLSTENLHATTVALNGRAVLISGRSGSGKSDLALRLLDRGFMLVSDDRTILRRDGPALIASSPANIRGKLEVRGIGIIDLESMSDVPVALAVELTGEMQRLPDDNPEKLILGVAIPVVRVDALTASAPSKVALALDRLGLKF